MFDPVLVNILLTTFVCGACSSLAAVVVRFLDRRKSGVRLEHAAAIGFLIGAAFGALYAIFQSMVAPP